MVVTPGNQRVKKIICLAGEKDVLPVHNRRICYGDLSGNFGLYSQNR